jgi:hypothetical protein
MYFPSDFIKKKNNESDEHFFDVESIIMYEKQNYAPDVPPLNSEYFKLLVFNDNTFIKEKIDKEEFEKFKEYYNQIDDKYKKNQNELITECFFRYMIYRYTINITSFLN